MRSTLYRSASSPRDHKARGFTLTELMVMVAIIVAVLAVTVPSFTVIRRDLELSKARSDVSASLAAARTRALRDRTMVALHIFRDTGSVYSVPRDDPTDSTVVAYNQSTLATNSFRWGAAFDATTGRPAYGLPHVPTNKMVMRLEVVNPDSLHNTNATVPTAVEFLWPADHEPVVLPDSLGICRPQTNLDYTVYTELSDPNPALGRVRFAEDFYIVFAEDGKIASVLVDYDLFYSRVDPPAAPSRATNMAYTNLYPDMTSTTAASVNTTWSASGLCLYDTTTYKAQTSTAAAYNYVNRPDNTVMISPYTGQPMEAMR